MGYLIQAKTEQEIKKLTVAGVKKEYNALADYYNKILEGKVLYCHHCNDWISSQNFYGSSDYASGYFPICKKCCLEIVEQRKKKTDKPNETKESVMNMLHMMNLPYIDELYESCCKTVAEDVNEKNRKSPFLHMITILRSLPQYRGKTWDDSEMPIESDGSNATKKIKQATIRRFGGFGFSESDLLFLQNEYETWVTRNECKTVAQETLFERICCKKLEIAKATRAGKDTKDLDKALQDLMSSAKILPRQNSSDTLSEGQTLGTLIQKWENERPLPEVSPELKDVDKIGEYIDVFFKGHMAKLLNLKNPLQRIYENFMKKYTVTKPEYDEDSDSEELFDKIFGKEEN